jgi:predicted  nucleic acid-binding Zn-ribbon protein
VAETPLPAEELDRIRKQADGIIRIFGDDWPLVYDWPDVSARYEDEDAPFTNVFVELFTTSQWPEDQETSPLAEFLATSIKTVPRLLAEVDRLRIDLTTAEGQRDDHRKALKRSGDDVTRLRAERERDVLELIDERDNLEVLLDKFADRVAPAEVIGEHSSANDPWLNALDLVTPAAEVERLTSVAHTQAAMVSEITSTCMAAEKERDRLRAELEANRQRWYHDDQSRTECVAGHDPVTRQCADGGGEVFSEVAYLTQLVEIWTRLTRSCESDVAQLSTEVARLSDALAGSGLAIADLERERGALAVRAADLQVVADAARAAVEASTADTSPEMSALRGLLATHKDDK